MRRIGGSRRYNQDGIKMERVARDAYKYTEADHAVLVHVEVQDGDPDYIVYAHSITHWLSPYEHDEITDEDRLRIIQRVGRFIEYYGETYLVR